MNNLKFYMELTFYNDLNLRLSNLSKWFKLEERLDYKKDPVIDIYFKDVMLYSIFKKSTIEKIELVDYHFDMYIDIINIDTIINYISLSYLNSLLLTGISHNDILYKIKINSKIPMLEFIILCNNLNITLNYNYLPDEYDYLKNTNKFDLI